MPPPLPPPLPPTGAARPMPAEMAVETVASADLMRAMGLPEVFTSTFSVQQRREAEEAEEEAYGARVREAWQQYGR